MTFYDALADEAMQLDILKTIATNEHRVSDLRFQAFGETAPFGVYVNDRDGKSVYVNPKVLELIGLSAGEASEKWPEIIHPEDRECVLREWSEHIATGADYRSRHRFLRPDGTVVWSNIVETAYYDGDTLLGYVGIIEDVTARADAEAQREELLERLQLMLDRMPIGCLLGDTEFRWTYWNPAAEAIFGYSFDEIRGKHPFGIITPESDQPFVEGIFKRIAEGDHVVDAIGQNTTKDGRTILCAWNNSPLRTSDGTFVGIISMCQDITARVEAEEAVRRSEEHYRQIVDTAQEGVWLIDADCVTTFVNMRMAEMLGYIPAEMIGKPYRDFMDGEARAESERHMDDRRAGVHEQYDFRFRRKDGTDLWSIVSASPMYDKDRNFIGSLGMVTDITVRKQNEEMVWWQAYHDTLTGLPNRALFEDRLGQLLVMSQRQGYHVAVLFLDLDRFKQVNDTLGHAYGDRLLTVVADRLKENLRAEDTIARMGGDEFTILLPGIEQPEAAVKVAQKLLEVLAQPFVLDDQELFIAGSIGISLYPADGEDAPTLLKHADVAMYRAKEQGGNGYHLFTQAMNTSALEHLIMENSLRRAVARNEFHLVYQPQIDLETSEVAAVEALCRWRHPDLGVVQPMQFIPLAEDTGIIVALGEWVLQEACRQAKEWADSGHPLRVSVNISARQFAQPGLVDTVANVLAQTGLAPDLLDLELTESAIMKNPDAAVDVVVSLRALGVRLSLDDFGTGYSSLSYLRKFPFDVLKIDRGFVANLVDDPVDAAIVEAMMSLAKALNLQVISEGVETDDQCNALQALGCNVMQGYLFSPPLTAERVPVLRPLMRSSRLPVT